MESTHTHADPPQEAVPSQEDVADVHSDVWKRLSASPDTPLPAGDAARYLDVSVSHLYRMAARRQVAHYKPNGKRIYFLKSDLDQYCLRNRVATDEEIERQAATHGMTKGVKAA